MLDFVLFVFQQFYNFIMYFDTIILFNTLSVLRFSLIILLFIAIFKFLGGKKND